MCEFPGQARGPFQEQIRHSRSKGRVRVAETISETPVAKDVAGRLYDCEPQTGFIALVGRIKELKLIAVADDNVRQAPVLCTPVQLLASHGQSEERTALTILSKVDDEIQQRIAFLRGHLRAKGLFQLIDKQKQAGFR